MLRKISDDELMGDTLVISDSMAKELEYNLPDTVEVNVEREAFLLNEALRKISKDELKTIIDRHVLWLDSCGTDGERANLSKTDLSGMDLTGANLKMADLSGSDLSGSDLTGANLKMADLSGSDLTGTNMENTNICLAKIKNIIASPEEVERIRMRKIECKIYENTCYGLLTNN